MDSGNSDSFQSSNGGDEEYNSRGGGDAISAYINQAVARGGLVYNTPPHQSTNHSMFDPILSNYQNLQNNIFPKNNLDMVLSNPYCTETITTLTSQQPFTIHQNSNERVDRTDLEKGKICMPSSSSSVAEIMNTTTSRNSSLPLSENHQTHGLPSVRNQNPKKRSRASRRAPTTVLTTDTNNFRAMVQEFTGIPAPPFTSSSLFPRNNTKLDNLFGTPSSSMRANPLDYSISLSSHQPPPYLRRPFPQKAQPLVSPSSSSSMFGASMVDSLRTNVDDSYQSLQTSNVFTMQNPILTSLLQSNHPNSTLAHHPSIFESKTHHGSVQIQSSNGFLQDQEDNNSSLGELPGLVSADPARWGGGDGGANGLGGDRVRLFGDNNGGCDDLPRNVANGKRLKGMMEDGARSSEGDQIKGVQLTEIDRNSLIVG